ncbi:MAG: hypothetical protein ACREQB_11065 [Candidatus Binataceae bacterium]
MAAEGDTPRADAPVKLDDLQKSVLLPQIQAFIDATSDREARETYRALLAAVDAMEVAPDLQARLGAIVEIALASGRVRKLFGPAAEQSLTSLFQGTPRGREIAAAIAAVNAALHKLNGQALDSATVSLRAPGAYALTLKTAACQLVIRFEQSGIRMESVEVDLS